MTEGETTGIGGISREESDLLPLWTTALALGIGAIGGALVAAKFMRAKAGDEAPIRVKNGSIELQLLNGGRIWVPIGIADGRRWRVSGGSPRDVDEYALRIEAVSGACSSSSLHGNNVRYTHADGNWIHVQSTGRRTRVIASAPLEVSGDGGLLRYAAPGHIVSIGVGGNEHCTFSSPQHLHAVYMTEP